MTGNDYQIAALRTAGTGNNAELLVNGVLGLCGETGECADLVKKFEFQGHELDTRKLAELLVNGVLGLCGETGECADLVKKFEFQGHELDTRKLAEELGDVAWYLAVTAYSIGYNLDYIFQMNVEKLKARYPDGFTIERSIHRPEYEKGEDHD